MLRLSAPQRSRPTLGDLPSRAGRSGWAGLVALCTLLVSPPAPSAPTPTPRDPDPQPPIFEDSVAVSWVLVPVVVRSRSGYVRELQKSDFRLWVDGQPVPIASFDPRSDAPISLVWLQDLSGSMDNGGKLEASRRALTDFLDHAQPEDGFAIATFAGGRLQVDVPFTSDRRALEESASLWRGWSTTALHDAVAWVPEIVAEGRHRKRAVVLITDGVDNASQMAPAEARYLVRRAHLPVYVLGMTSGDPERIADGEPERSYAHLLELLARASGGRFYPVTDPGRIGEAVQAVRDELRHQYVLGFPARTEGVRSYRRIRVEVAGRRKVEVLYREGYMGGAPAAGAGES